jgi:6-carboxyhexanoate--CoA ligase
MRSSLGGRHVSGAERVIEEEQIPDTLLELLKRPKEHDFLKITLERVEHVEEIKVLLPISSYEFESVKEAREFALRKLEEAGVPRRIAKEGLRVLEKGANPEGGNMRGAVLMDIANGERLEPDRMRGVRTVRVDWKDRSAVERELLSKGLTRRSLDAIAIATKNIHCGIVAELCWSDDPDYLTGYVASRNTGYVRITPLKERGSPLGGRVYFIHREDLKELIRCLERKVVLVSF